MTNSNQTTTEAQRFTKDIIWVAIYQVLSHALGIISLPVLTKTYSVELYGVWTQIGVTVGLISPIITLQFTTAAVRFLATENDVNLRRRKFGTMLWPIVFLALTVFVIALLFGKDLSLFIFSDSQYTNFVYLASIWVALDALFSLGTAYLRARGKVRKYSVINIALSTANTLIIVIMSQIGLGIEWIIGAILAFEGLILLFLYWAIISEIGVSLPNTTRLRRFLAFSLPQIPAGILMWVINVSDRYFITHLIDLSHAGIYSASYSLGNLVSLFYYPISFVLLPSLSRFWENKQIPRVKNYLEYSNKLFLSLAIPATAGIYILSQPLLTIFTTNEYAVGSTLVLLISLGAILHGIYQINLFVIYLVEKTKWIPLMILAAAVINAGINIVLIPKVGIIGAAISTIAAYLILVVIVTIWAQNIVSYKYDFKFITKIILASIIMALCLRYIPTENILEILLAIIAGLIIYVICLIILKTFSKQDFNIISNIFKITLRKQ
jgi:O-antigen/teichoic acid export membrane protein